MNDKERILKLLYIAFLEIRIASYAKDSNACFILSDVFHNIPLEIDRADRGEMSYADIIVTIQRRCEERKCISWLNNANSNITKET